jgi:hypothetical protein
MTMDAPTDPMSDYLSAVRGAGESADRRAEIAWLQYLGELEQGHGDQPVAVQQAGAQFLSGLLNDESVARDTSAAAEQDAQLGFAVYRAANRAQRSIRADQQASFLEAMELRQNAIEAAAQDITVNPQAQRALDAGLAGVWRDLVNLGPREGFTLGEIAVPPDATRAGFLSAEDANRHYQSVSDRAVEAIAWGQWQASAQDEDSANELLSAFPQLREDQRARLGQRMRDAVAAADIQFSRMRVTGEGEARNAVDASRGGAVGEGFELLAGDALRADWLAEQDGALRPEDQLVLRRAVAGTAGRDDRAKFAALTQAAEDSDRDEFAIRAARAVDEGRLTPASYAALVARNRAAEKAPHRGDYLRMRDAFAALARPESTAHQTLAAPRDAALDEFDRWRRANPQATPGEARKTADEIMTRTRLHAWERASMRLAPPIGFADETGALTQHDLAMLQRAAVAALVAGQLTFDEVDARLLALDEWRSVLTLKPVRGER